MTAPSRPFKFDHELARRMRRQRMSIPTIAARLRVRQETVARAVAGVLSEEEERALRAEARRANMRRLWADPEFRHAALVEAWRTRREDREFFGNEEVWL